MGNGVGFPQSIQAGYKLARGEEAGGIGQGVTYIPEGPRRYLFYLTVAVEERTLESGPP